MNFNDFIKYYAKVNELTYKKSREEIERFIYAFATALRDEGFLSIKDFATFKTIYKPERTRKSNLPGHEGAAFTVPAEKVIKIDFRQRLKDVVNERIYI